MSKGRHTFVAARFRTAIIRGVDRGLTAIAVVLGATVTKMLSKPGRGRVYVRDETHRGKRRLSAKAIRAARASGVPIRFFRKDSGKAGAFISRAALAQILLDRRAGGKKKRTLRALGFHKASAPGDPPAVDTGHLRRSWQTGFRTARPGDWSRGRRIVIGSNLPYARLEFGYGRAKPRPYLRPSARLVQPKAGAIMDRFVSAEIAKLGGRR